MIRWKFVGLGCGNRLVYWQSCACEALYSSPFMIVRLWVSP